MNLIFKLIAKALASDLFFNLIRWWAFRHPYQHIYNEGEYYMGRWWVLKERPWLPFAIRLHQIALPDIDRHLHDHRSWYRTFILRGWYAEECEGNYGMDLHRTGDTVGRPLGHFHRICGVSTHSCWTLFVYGKHVHDWGFKVDGTKVHWETYLELKDVINEKEAAQ